MTITSVYRNSVLEVLNTPEINHLKENGRVVVQMATGSTPGYYIVEHVDSEELLKGKVEKW